jgi:hypothetical protein
MKTFLPTEFTVYQIKQFTEFNIGEHVFVQHSWHSTYWFILRLPEGYTIGISFFECQSDIGISNGDQNETLLVQLNPKVNKISNTYTAEQVETGLKMAFEKIETDLKHEIEKKQEEIEKLSKLHTYIITGFRQMKANETQQKIIKHLKETHTKVLLQYLKHARACGGCYSPWEYGDGITIEQIKEELALREHVPNKKESKEIRKAKKKQGN